MSKISKFDRKPYKTRFLIFWNAISWSISSWKMAILRNSTSYSIWATNQIQKCLKSWLILKTIFKMVEKCTFAHYKRCRLFDNFSNWKIAISIQIRVFPIFSENLNTTACEERKMKNEKSEKNEKIWSKLARPDWNLPKSRSNLKNFFFNFQLCVTRRVIHSEYKIRWQFDRKLTWIREIPLKIV